MADDNAIEIPIIGNPDPLLKILTGLAGTVAAAFTFKEMIGAAMEAENAVNALNNAMKITGTYTESASNSFQAYSAELQKTTGVQDDFINQQAAMLVSIGKLEGDGLKRATKAALDLSAATGKGLEESFMLMAKAATGSTEALGRVGIKIDEGFTKSEKFAAALAKINSQMGGAAEGQMNTFSGALKGVENGFKDLLEELGKLFTQSPVVIALVKEVAKWFDSLGDSVKKFGKSGDVIGELIKTILNVGLVITQYVLPPFELLYNIGDVVFRALKTGVQAIVAGFANVGAALGSVLNMVGAISDDTLTDIQNFAEVSGETLQKFSEETNKSAEDVFNFDASVAATKFVENVQAVAEAARPHLATLQNGIRQAMDIVDVGDAFRITLDGMGSAAQEFARHGTENFRKLGNQMFQSVGQGAGQAFAAFGKAIAKGENALTAFLNSLLSSMGQMAIQLGTQFILQGAAYMWAGMPNGPALIAAGAALAAFGGIMGAIGGGGGAGAGDTGGGGGGGSTGAGDLNTQKDDMQQAAKKPDTNIVVQVQGNILDRRATGLELAEVMQETFGTQGINYKT